MLGIYKKRPTARTVDRMKNLNLVAQTKKQNINDIMLWIFLFHYIKYYLKLQ